VAVCPSESSCGPHRWRRCRRRRSSHGLSLPFRVFHSPRYRPHDLSDPATPLVQRPRGVLSASCVRPGPGLPDAPLLGLRHPPEYSSGHTSPRSEVGGLLSWASGPYSTSGRAGPLNASRATRYVPPSGFGYPLGGLLPAEPCRACFIPAALLGFTLRSLPLARVPRCSHRGEPTCRSRLGCLPGRTKSHWKGLLRRLLGFRPGPRARASDHRCYRHAGTPLGFAPSRACSPAA
jgi:hypothetical protein